MAFYPTSTPSDTGLYVAVDNFASTLNGAINASQTTITLASVVNLPTSGILTIDSEKVLYSGISINDITGVTRGFSATTASSHANGAGVFHNVVEEHHNALKDEIIAVATDLRNAITADLDDTVSPATTATNLKVRLDQISTQLKNIISGGDWKDSITVPLSSKATDSLVVHLAGTETITGTKTFSNTIAGATDGNALRALSNLSAVSINTTLVSDTDNTDDLGTSTIGWKDLYITSSIKRGTATGLSIATSGDLTAPHDFTATRASVGGNVIIATSNTNNTDTGSNARFDAVVGGTGAGDPFMQLTVPGGSTWSLGIDNSASDAFKISRATTLGTNDDIIISTTTDGVSIKGTNTNDSASAGFVGEYIESVVSAVVSAATSTQYKDTTSISLTAGDWDVTGNTLFFNNGATITRRLMAISVNSGNTTTDHVLGSNVADVPAPSDAAGADSFGTIANYRLSLSSTTTVYLKQAVTYSAGTPQLQNGKISARRVR